MLLFTNGLLLGAFVCCIFFYYIDTKTPGLCKLPDDRLWREEHNGTVSFQDIPGFQNIPCLIEIYHTSRWGYDERTRPVEHHTEIRRYKLSVILPAALVAMNRTFYNIIDSDGVSMAVYIGSTDTLIQY